MKYPHFVAQHMYQRMFCQTNLQANKDARCLSKLMMGLAEFCTRSARGDVHGKFETLGPYICGNFGTLDPESLELWAHTLVGTLEPWAHTFMNFGTLDPL